MTFHCLWGVMCLQYDYFLALTSCLATNVDSGSLLSVTGSDQDKVHHIKSC